MVNFTEATFFYIIMIIILLKFLIYHVLYVGCVSHSAAKWSADFFSFDLRPKEISNPSMFLTESWMPSLQA